VERANMMIRKGEGYKEKVEQKRKEKSEKETEGCSFMP